MKKPSAPPAKPSPRESLLPVPTPKLDRLEPDVARQIESVQQSVLELNTKSRASDAELAEAYGSLGQILHAYELTDAARACYLNARKLSPKSASWAHLLGCLELQAGQLDQAEKTLSEARAMRPEYVATAIHLGNTYLQLNRAADAQKQFEAALQLKPGEAAAHNGLGEVALAGKKFDAAVKHFDEALKLAPAANRLHYSLGMAHRGAGDLKQAQAHLDQRGNVGVRPDDPLLDGLKKLLKGEHVHLTQGQLAFKVGRFPEAVAAFTKAVEANPDSVISRVNLGAALAQAGEREKAVEQLELVLKDHPNEHGARFNLASLLRGQKKHDEAIRELQHVLKISPVDVDAMRSLADSLIQLDRSDEALQMLFKATALAPDNELVVLDLSNLLARQQRFVEARAVLEAAHRHSPEKGLTAHALARFLAACPDLARRDGAKAVELAGKVYQARKSLEHAQTLVLALAEAGRCDEAATLLKRMVEEVEKAGNAELATRLKADLKRYEQGSPCRPITAADASKTEATKDDTPKQP